MKVYFIGVIDADSFRGEPITKDEMDFFETGAVERIL